MDIEKINEFNTVVISSYNTFKYPTALDIVLPGYFKGSDVMFVMQHIEDITKDSDVDVKYYDAFNNKDVLILEHYLLNTLLKNSLGSGQFIKDTYGMDWSKASITSVFKCPFIDNITPDELSIRELSILDFQIRLVKPKVIVAIGAVAYRALQELHVIDKYNVIKATHPTKSRSTDTYTEEISKIHSQLQNEAKT